jgi:ubiquinone/menaquinone biosynthesis C-methylase UbiE
MTEWNKKRQTMRHYNHSAKVYDTLYNQEQNAKMEEALDGLPLKKDSFILDAGCGTGLLFSYVTGITKLIVGADISAGVLMEAKVKAKQYSNVALFRVDADYIPFSDHVFDAVFAVTLLQNVPDPQQTLFEMKRVSKNDGFIVATGLKKTFPRDEFGKLLRKAGLKILVMKEDKLQKEHIAFCTKQRTS